MKTILTNIVLRTTIVFVFLFIISFSSEHPILPNIGMYTHTFFESITAWFARNILQIKRPFINELISDSTAFYINALWIFCFATIVAIVWQNIDKQNNYRKWYSWFLVFVRYYLAIQLLTYGLNKVFKWQFYLPEPNTLFTTIGNTYKDLLYWSSMGTSRMYSIFTGLIEVVAALLLLFKRTTLLGACLAFAVMLNIVFINLSFDISVKLYSLFLTFLTCLIIQPHAKELVAFLLTKNYSTNIFLQRKSKHKFLIFVKWMMILLIIVDGLAVYVKSNNYNDDAQPKPLLHGAYEATIFVVNGDTLPPLTTDTIRWRRIFMHNRGYLITQYMNDAMQDYELQVDSIKHTIAIVNTEDSSRHFFNYSKSSDTTLTLNGKLYKDSLNIHFNKIDLKKLPLLQNEFSWTID
jgi:uncharacterized membrane protein YphA (DoxX/SURF4 family)